jgi:2-phosphosulfolactate phosphatase
MLDLEVILTAQSVTDQQVEGRTVVVIDVLRATSTMITAFSNHARAIVPVSSLEEAQYWQNKLGNDDCILCGEKDGLKIPGYHLGNSPQEFTKQAVGDKIIIMNTTNGTKAITNSKNADSVLIGSFLNAQSVIDAIQKKGNAVTLVCSGWKERLSLEDMLCAGLIIDRLLDVGTCVLNNDYAKITHATYQAYQENIPQAVKESSHAMRLKSIAPVKDFEYCSQIDVQSIAPYVKNGMIIV